MSEVSKEGVVQNYSSEELQQILSDPSNNVQKDLNNMSEEQLNALLYADAVSSPAAPITVVTTTDPTVSKTEEVGKVVDAQITPVDGRSEQQVIQAIREKMGKVTDSNTQKIADSAQYDSNGQMIPKPRFDELVDQRNKANQEAAYYKGLAEAAIALKTQGGAAGNEQKTAPSPVKDDLEQINLLEGIAKEELEKELSDLEKRHEDGDLAIYTAPQYYKAARAIEQKYSDRVSELQSIRQTILYNRSLPDPIELQKRVESNPEVQAVTNQLMEDHKEWMDNVPDAVIPFIKQQAAESLKAQGYDDFQMLTPEGSLRYRQEVVRVAGDVFKYKPEGYTPPSKRAQQPAGGAPSSRSLSPQEQAIVNKLALARTMPPNVSNAGVASTDGGNSIEKVLTSITSSEGGSMKDMDALIKNVGGLKGLDALTQ